MKKIFNAIGKKTRDAKFQQRAVKKMEDIEKGEKIPAPRYPTEDKRYQEAQADDSIREELQKKHTTLIDNMNKINVKSTDPVERWTSAKDLPTRESEWMHRNDPVWEYGFYEPEEERIPKNKLMFREALEVLRARQEAEEESNAPNSAKLREEARAVYENHKAVARVDKEKLDDMWEYFRPFVRKDYQKVVPKFELEQLQAALQGMSDETKMVDSTKDGIRKIFQRNKDALEHYDRLESAERKQLQEAIIEQRQAEKDRLTERLKSMELVDEESKKIVEEVKKGKAAEANEEK